jgi:nicotinate phosphoribosyltransferase
MLEAALRSGVAHRASCFEVYARTLPPSRSYGVVSGTLALPAAIESFKFKDAQLRFLESNTPLTKDTLDYLANFRFSGSIWGYRDGEVYFPNSPVLRVEAKFAEALILETLILSTLNFETAVASAASRMVQVSRGKSLIEMGSRRTAVESAVLAARAAYISGFDATSNLEAGRRYGIPTQGTVGHALILAHDNELEAFRAQHRVYGAETTVLVDTYDIYQGIENAVSIFGPGLRAIRIDSGDLKYEAERAKQRLVSLGAKNTKIVLSGDLDEYALSDLSGTCADAFGVGTRLVSGSGYPSANFVYKLVAIDGGSGYRAVAKTSPSKSSKGGVKDAIRRYDDNGILRGEFIIDPHQRGPRGWSPADQVQIPIITEGKDAVKPTPVSRLRQRHLELINMLPEQVRTELQPEGPYTTAVALQN